ncbi:MAG: type II secretion system F family protein [Gaiellaceae bacterium]
MTRRRVVAIVLGLLALATAVPAAAVSGRIHITEAGASSFPGRAYVLSLPRGMQLKPSQVHVTENGGSVAGMSVIPVAEAHAQDFGVVLAIDASTSMEGKPERAAFYAAEAFAAQRKGQEQLAVVTYNLSPTVVLPFTTDQTKIDRALSVQPPFVYGTHIYDAVVQSLGELRKAHISAGTLVLLSDGQEQRGRNDVGKHETAESAAAAARAAHVRIFAVGLRSRLSNLETLRKLARETGGRYVESTSIAQLATIYNELGSQLANEYLVRYQSLAGPGKRINVKMRVAGLDGEASTAYDTPKLTVVAAGPKAPYHPSLSNRLWSSFATMIVVGLATAILIGTGAVALVSGPRKGTVRRRMAEFVSVPTVVQEASGRPTAQLTASMLKGTERALRGSTRWRRFRWELGIAEVAMPPEQIVVLTVIGSFVSLIAIKYLSGSLLAAIAIAIAIPFAVRSQLKRRLAKRRLLFAEQLPDNLNVLSSALRAGHSFIGALSVVVNDAAEPSKSEFQRVIADEQLGVSIDEALHVVVERMDSRELEQVALVAALQRETGGNTAEVLDRVTETIRERFELRRTVKTLTAQGRMSRWVLTSLPLFLLVVITLINPSYMHILYSSTGGKVLLVLSAISVTAGSLVIKRIVNIKV